MGDNVFVTSIQGNPSVGLFGFATDTYCLVGTEVPQKVRTDISEALHVPVHAINIAGTSLIGAFLAGNKHALLVPMIAFDEEIAALKKLGIKVHIIDTRLTALGNNILCTDTMAWVHPEYSAETKAEIAKALNVKVESRLIATIPTVGSCAVINDKGAIIHHDASEKDIEVFQQEFKIVPERASVNRGSPVLRSGVLANNLGVIIGSQSGRPEIINIEEGLHIEP